MTIFIGAQYGVYLYKRFIKYIHTVHHAINNIIRYNIPVKLLNFLIFIRVHY